MLTMPIDLPAIYLEGNFYMIFYVEKSFSNWSNEVISSYKCGCKTYRRHPFQWLFVGESNACTPIARCLTATSSLCALCLTHSVITAMIRNSIVCPLYTVFASLWHTAQISSRQIFVHWLEWWRQTNGDNIPNKFYFFVHIEHDICSDFCTEYYHPIALNMNAITWAHIFCMLRQKYCATHDALVKH